MFDIEEIVTIKAVAPRFGGRIGSMYGAGNQCETQETGSGQENAMDNFEQWWNDRSKFWKGIRTGDHDLSLEALGYWRTTPVPSSVGTDSVRPPAPTSPRSTADYQCGVVCGLIEVGLVNHPERLNAAYWQQAKNWLERFDPATPGITQHLDDLIDRWRRFASDAGESRDVLDLMNAASFRTWADQLVAATEQYRDVCAKLRGAV